MCSSIIDMEKTKMRQQVLPDDLKTETGSQSSPTIADYEEEEEDVKGPTIADALQKLLKQVRLERQAHVKMRMDTNKERLKEFTDNIASLDMERKEIWEVQEPSGLVVLCKKGYQLLSSMNGSDSSGERDGRSGMLESNGNGKPISIIFGSQIGGKTPLRHTKLVKVENVPRYTTWIYLDRNQRMTEDQSVVGRRRIYYDSDGNETLIASDSEEEDPGDDDDKEESKHDFTKGEDSLIWMAIQELGLDTVVIDELSDMLDIRREEIEARYDSLLKVSIKRSEVGLPPMQVVGALSTGKISPQGRRKTSTKELAREAAREAKELKRGAFKDVLNDSEKEVIIGDNALQVGSVLEATASVLAIKEEDKIEPKDLLTAMDSFDNLFCRRCLVFDCRLHGCSQAIVHPSERQQPWTGAEEMQNKPCGRHCRLLFEPIIYENTTIQTDVLLLKDAEAAEKEVSASPEQDQSLIEDNEMVSQRRSKRSKISNKERSSSSDSQALAALLVEEPLNSLQLAVTGVEQTDMGMKEKKLDKRSSATRKSLSRRVKRLAPQGDLAPFLKPHTSQEESIPSPENEKEDLSRDEQCALKEEGSSNLENATKLQGMVQSKLSGKRSPAPKADDVKGSDQHAGDVVADCEVPNVKNEIVPLSELGSKEECILLLEDGGAPSNIVKVEVGLGWSELEMGLYEKGLQVFGRNSCLIARNMLQGLKTCAEVYTYSRELDAAGQGSDGVRRFADSLDIEAATRARLYGGRRKGRVRKLKYTWKSVARPILRKRMANGKDQPCRQYTPCNCLYTCGKQCPCLLNGTCCEKYCGCSKNCKNRFRGCHCAKSQCCSRQCPCSAAGRECDPDVCRNCWVGCGDGSLGGPPPRGDNYECHNMKLMLKQQQRVLLGRSDVAGWGAFLKSPVSKHEYLGEYTGELISHREADKRGKIYDRENSSFLFNLNDQYVLDACRKGDKLKFANHSPQPNCYAKVIMVSGDHRVGIFAKEKITAGEELFYDYQYEPDRAPSWAKKPDDPNHKRDSLPSTSGRAQKAA